MYAHEPCSEADESLSILIEKMLELPGGKEKGNWTKAVSTWWRTPAMRPLETMGQNWGKKKKNRIKLPGIIMLKRTAICREGKKNLCLYNLETLPNWLDRYSNTAKLSQRLEMSPQNSPFLETHRPAMFAPHHGPHNGAWLCIVPPVLWESWLERLPEEWSPQATPNPACQLLCQRFGSASSDRVP